MFKRFNHEVRTQFEQEYIEPCVIPYDTSQANLLSSVTDLNTDLEYTGDQVDYAYKDLMTLHIMAKDITNHISMLESKVQREKADEEYLEQYRQANQPNESENPKTE